MRELTDPPLREGEQKIVTILGAVLLACGYLSQIWMGELGQLYWAEPILPAVAVVLVGYRFPLELFRNTRLRVVVAALFLMLVGYVVSDLAAHTPPERYLRGWARVLVLGTDAVSLVVIYDRNRWALWWFWTGLATHQLQSAVSAGLLLTDWKFGYGEPAFTAALNSSVFLPGWMSAALCAVVGAASIVLDYRSQGAVLLGVSAILLMSGANKRESRATSVGKRSKVLVMAAVVAAAAVIIGLTDYSNEQYAQRRGVSNTGRFAALRIGATAIADSPILGYGSWGQGTEKYASMLYDDTLDDMLSIDAGNMVQSSSVFLSHSQIIQAWMEGGILAAFFFVAYGWYLITSIRDLSLTKTRIPFRGFLLGLLLMSLWHLFMSPFLGSHRLNIASAVAIVVCGTMVRGSREHVKDLPRVSSLAPPNLLR